jgi:hypothetical protein
LHHFSSWRYTFSSALAILQRKKEFQTKKISGPDIHKFLASEEGKELARDSNYLGTVKW